PGQQLEKVGRVGKFLLFYWTDVTWVAHLRMEGKYLYDPTDCPVDQYTHVICHLTDGHDLRYRDVRKFGRIHMVEKADTEAEIAKLKLGPEPKDLTVDYLQKRFDKTTRPIKAVLLDQGVLRELAIFMQMKSYLQRKSTLNKELDHYTTRKSKPLLLRVVGLWRQPLKLVGQRFELIPIPLVRMVVLPII